MTGARGWRAGPMLRLAVQLAILGIVAAFLVRRAAEFRDTGSLLSHLRWPWIVVALVAELGSVMPLAAMQRALLRAAGARIGLGRMLPVTLASNAITYSLPVGMALSEGWAFRQYRRFGADAGVAAWAELGSGAVSFATLAGLALLGSLLVRGRSGMVLVGLLAAVFAGAGAVVALFRRPKLLAAGLEAIAGRAGRLGGERLRAVAGRVGEAAVSMEAIRVPPRAWADVVGLAGANWVLEALCLAASFLAVRHGVPWASLLLVYAGSQVLATISFLPGGLGLVEGGLVVMFVAYGVPTSVAGAAVVVYRGLSLLVLVALGWLAWGWLHVGERRAAARSGGPPSGPS